MAAVAALMVLADLQVALAVVVVVAVQLITVVRLVQEVQVILHQLAQVKETMVVPARKQQAVAVAPRLVDILVVVAVALVQQVEQARKHQAPRGKEVRAEEAQLQVILVAL